MTNSTRQSIMQLLESKNVDLTHFEEDSVKRDPGGRFAKKSGVLSPEAAELLAEQLGLDIVELDADGKLMVPPDAWNSVDAAIRKTWANNVTIGTPTGVGTDAMGRSNDAIKEARRKAGQDAAERPENTPPGGADGSARDRAGRYDNEYTNEGDGPKKSQNLFNPSAKLNTKEVKSKGPSGGTRVKLKLGEAVDKLNPFDKDPEDDPYFKRVRHAYPELDEFLSHFENGVMYRDWDDYTDDENLAFLSHGHSDETFLEAYGISREDVLHYGIKGMKWGRRRSDSQLAKARSGKDKGDSDDDGSDDGGSGGRSGGRKVTPSVDAERTVKTATKAEVERSDREIREAINRAKMVKEYEALFGTDSDPNVALRQKVERMTLEKKAQELTPQRKSMVDRLVKGATTTYSVYETVDKVTDGAISSALKDAVKTNFAAAAGNTNVGPRPKKKRRQSGPRPSPTPVFEITSLGS